MLISNRERKQMTSSSTTKIIVTTVECYDAWSHTYDSDGNILQLIDDVAFEEIAQPLLSSSFQNHDTKKICCELGCGTGRNTKKILGADWFVVSIEFNRNTKTHSMYILTFSHSFTYK